MSKWKIWAIGTASKYLGEVEEDTKEEAEELGRTLRFISVCAKEIPVNDVGRIEVEIIEED